MTKTSEFARALENAIDELKEKGYTDDDVILDCEGNEITQNEIVCSLLAEQVVEALEKQIPRKPITRNELVKTERGYALLDENEQEYCPVCNYFVQPPCERYCSHCGQALDWSDTE